MDKKNKAGYIDVDRTVLEPSPQRVRNILTIEERVRAIQAYDCRPMYTKVAKMFNCSWEQIKNIIANRDEILAFYTSTQKAAKKDNSNDDEIRQRKITFLGECMYEYIQRSQFHTKADLTEELIRMKALEFRDIIQIDNFVPNKAWINHFKATYNFSLSNRQITLTRTPPSSLDLKNIMTYCTKNKMKVNPVRTSPVTVYRTATKIAVSCANDATLEELIKRRQRKVNFLEKALHEYVLRSRYHHKVSLTEDGLRRVAFELKEMLKIDNFYPNKTWFHHFKATYEISLSMGISANSHTPPLSLDLKDILSYCSRHDNKNQTPLPITLAPKEPQAPRVARDKAVRTRHTMSPVRTAKPPKPSLVSPEMPRPLIKEEIIEIDQDQEPAKPEEDIKPDISQLEVNRNRRLSQPEEPPQVEPNKRRRSSQMNEPPPLKIHKIESIYNGGKSGTLSPGHWSEHSDKDDGEELPRRVRNNEDALKLLKPLEEYAMLQENYRAIGIITQLEAILRNSTPAKGDAR